MDYMALIGQFFKTFEISLNAQFFKKSEVIKSTILFDKMKANLFLDAEPLKSLLRELKQKDMSIKE